MVSKPLPSRSVLRALLAAILLAGCLPPAGGVRQSAASPLDLYPPDYETARARFREACGRALAVERGDCGSIPLPGDGADDLTIDTAYLTRGSSRLIIVQSGLHGVEAYAGSAVQLRVLDAHLASLLAAGFDLLLIHAVNPYGFRHDLRTDATNVNLNRNFATDPALFQRRNPAYAELRWVFEPAGPVASVARSRARAGAALLAAVVAHGFDGAPVAAAMNAGQYEFPAGLAYGGSGPRPQVEILSRLLRPLIAGHPGDILFLDLHTGLGAAGRLHVMPATAGSDRLRDRLAAMVEALRPAGIGVSTGDDPGFYPTSGDVIDFVPSLADDPSRVLGATLEYGTVGTGALAELGAASTLIAENQARMQGCGSPAACDRIRAEFREHFAPESPEWRDAVIREADAFFTALARDL